MTYPITMVSIPRLGTFEDFVTCIRKAGERGLRVMIDLVMDHSSDQHPWFQAARRDRHSRYRRYYFWTDAPPPMEPGQAKHFPRRRVQRLDL